MAHSTGLRIGVITGLSGKDRHTAREDQQRQQREYGNALTKVRPTGPGLSQVPRYAGREDAEDAKDEVHDGRPTASDSVAGNRALR